MNTRTRQEAVAAPAKRGSQSKHAAYKHPIPLVAPPSLRTTLAKLFIPSLFHAAFLPRHILGYYDPSSNSVWITDEDDVWTCWSRGFFGKGTLSRSEPSWFAREKSRLSGVKALTAEEVREKRRKDRREIKIKKAAEKAILEGTTPPAATPQPVETPKLVITEEKQPPVEVHPELAADAVNLEHLQLQAEEAFWLIYTVDSLRIYTSPDTKPLNMFSAWDLFTQSAAKSPTLRTDNPFIVSYAVYHYFRSLNWVVRNGVKFCTDWVLYKGSDGTGMRGCGPVGGHAEFAVVILPTYENPDDEATSESQLWTSGLSDEEKADLEGSHNGRRSWKWLSTVNRVCSGVKKTLMLCYVTIPSSKRISQRELQNPIVIQNYAIEEILVRRFIPARMRD